MSAKRLCPHVDITLDRSADPPTLTASGAVYPCFSWSRELEADIPRLKCSTCGRAVKILGFVVRRARPFLEEKST